MGDRLDLFAFDSMEYATADKTAVDLLGDKAEVTKDDVHNMLMAAGFTPGLGNIADAADAVLYAAEGEFGSAALSAAAMIPFIGQWISAKRALKLAKKSGEEMVTLYRGVQGIDDVNVMIKKGSVVGNWGDRVDMSKTISSGAAEGTGRKAFDSVYGPTGPIVSTVPEKVNLKNTLFTSWKKSVGEKYAGESGMILKFEVPKSWINKHGRNAFGGSLSREGQGWGEMGFKKASNISYPSLVFTDGLPTAFLTTVKKVGK